MSLISQNAHSKKLKRVVKTDEIDGSHLNQENEVPKVLDEPKVDGLKSKKRRKQVDQKEAEIIQENEMKENNEMEKLENFLFGSLYSPVEFGKEENRQEQDGTNGGPALFYIDRSVNGEEVDDGEEVDEKPPAEREPVWIDDEEEKTVIDISKVNRLRKLRRAVDENMISGTSYVSRLRAQHVKLNPGTEWAQVNTKSKNYRSDDDSDIEQEDRLVVARGYDIEADDEVLRSNEDLVIKSGSKLLPGVLEFSRLLDANAQDHSKSVINSVQFHRNGQLLLVAGLDRRLKFFQIDGKHNTKIESIFLEDCPIRKAAFIADGSQVIVGGRRKFFYAFDLVKARIDKIGPLTGREERSLECFEVSPDSSTIAFVGNEGYILLVSTRTKELIGTLKMNGSARSLAFADDGRQLLSSGGDGFVYHWDLRTRTCFHKAVDEGCIESSALCTSADSTYFASGSSSGIVNVYNRADFLGGKRKPIKAIDNLVTRIDNMKFNHDAQILAITSRMKINSLKLVHVPSFNVFSNWPPQNHLGLVSSLDFSPGGGFMAVGTAAGRVSLFKLHHYHRA